MNCLFLPHSSQNQQLKKTYWISATLKSEEIAEIVLTWAVLSTYYSWVLNPLISQWQSGHTYHPLLSMKKWMPEGLFKIKQCHTDTVFKCSPLLPESQFKPYAMVKVPLFLQYTFMVSLYTSGCVYYWEVQLTIHNKLPLACSGPSVIWPVSYLIFFTDSSMFAHCVCPAVA